jgi:hypothetical protein
MNMRSVLVQAVLLFAAPVAFAQSLGDIAPPVAPAPTYSCQVILIATDLPQGSLTFKYTVSPTNVGSHGGQEFPFAAGTHKISAISNDRWLGITWTKAGVLVASSVFARSEVNQGSMALIIYNPQNPEEQVSLDCSTK